LLRKTQKILGGYFILPHPVYTDSSKSDHPELLLTCLLSTSDEVSCPITAWYAIPLHTFCQSRVAIWACLCLWIKMHQQSKCTYRLCTLMSQIIFC